jgi:thiaminase
MDTQTATIASNYDADVKKRFNRLESLLAEEWKLILEQSPLIRTIMEGKADKRLFGLYMLETYQYTYHNARNQALVGTRSGEMPVKYMKFCFEHAEEETGHELMALHDLMELGLSRDEITIPAPLPATEVLIAYLYYVSANGNPLRRLGYSFWAENCYGYINPVISKIKSTLQLKDSQLTFFVAHSNIDEEHAVEVYDMIARFCKTEQDWQHVERVMLVSLRLQGRVLDDVFEAYKRLEAGNANEYSFLNKLG